MRKFIQITNIILTFVIFSFLAITIVNAQGTILTDTKKNEYNNKLNAVSQGSDTFSQTDSLETSIAIALKVVLGALGVIFIAMMFVAGNEWMQAAGNEEKIKKAQERIQSLIIGLVIILLGYALSSGFSKLLTNGLSLLK
ncbi:MAG TPA: hypothetical protein VFD16_01445 [Candidatus Saccharimonadales bacterium]|nr:hypothetical protein [Candidatus Saccharimonadales bacterium]